MAENRIRSHRDLVVWQKGIRLVTEVYRLSKRFPREELYGLTSQTRRAVVSVPANIAEGNRRSSTKDYANFLSIAHGSLMEVDTLIEVAVQLEYLAHRDTVQAWPCWRK